MKAMLIDAPPGNIHRFKDRAPASQSIFGAGVFASEFVEALLRHGSYDAYWCLRPPHVADDARRDPRLRFLDHQAIDDLSGLSQPVICSVFALFQEYRLIRRHFAPRRDWPITAFIMSIQAKSPPAWLLPMVLGDVRPWDALICPSRAGRRVIENYLAALVDSFPGIDPLQARLFLPVIPLGAEPIDDDPTARAAVRQELGVTDQDVVTLYVGRLSTILKADLVPLIVAFARLATRRPNARLVIAGDDTRQKLADTLMRQAAELGCAASVSIRPNPTHAQKHDLYRAADVFVSPSENVQETFGLTIAEAMAAGLPVVASDWNGYRDLVLDGETGFLVPTYWPHLGGRFDEWSLCGSAAIDGTLAAMTTVDVDRLTECLEVLTADCGLRRRIGAQARRRFASHFQWPVVIRQYEALWEELRERARREADAHDNASGVPQGIIRQTFSHYPTALLEADCEVSAAGVDEQDMLVTLSRHAAVPSGDYERVARAIVERVAAGPVTLGRLAAETASCSETKEFTVQLVVARLLKYGLLRIASAAAAAHGV